MLAGVVTPQLLLLLLLLPAAATLAARVLLAADAVRTRERLLIQNVGFIANNF